MKVTDGRRLDRETRQQLRIQAVQRVEAGESPEAVIRALGFHRSRIYHWLARYREGGVEALKSGRIAGRPPKLSAAQQQQLYHLLIRENPLHLGLASALWSADAVGELIRWTFGIHLSSVSIRRLLQRLGLSPGCPPDGVEGSVSAPGRHWWRAAPAEIRQLAREQKAAVFFAGRATVSSRAGATPAAPDLCPPLSLLVACNARGEVRFMVTAEPPDESTFLEFLRRLLHDVPQPLFLMVSRSSSYSSQPLRHFVEVAGGRLRLLMVPFADLGFEGSF